ncbi:multicomponent K+:H+ antiporter subunit D [Chitinivorax tropicus]|uniref:Multicomponent K+:H+ antiporter subunit D n=1 Tax=Chitinivorax tropicus TaxID=714531 RepID=A0A840MRD7_9PROT|nr:monovalent cation/H+ antiporter subunit D [Chitinivorax tropicus]MBB5019667.1 multicomponent K+:H+ antiporter subunit D [Chitinivorax tropicus]
MQHVLILPILLPLVMACCCVLAGDRIWLRRLLVLAGNALLAGLAVVLVWWAETDMIWAYMAGSWPAPFGIALVLDRLTAMLLLTTSLLSVLCYVYAWVRNWDARGRHFHSLWLLQMMGLNGAFLTGDLFNLFVFFEIMLAASYGLLLHGDGEPRLSRGFAYVTVNLLGSALFLIAASLFYGVVGTLNMADLARRIAIIDDSRWMLIRVAGMLLFVVFALKAAVAPLQLWLGRTYESASGPVAALFAVMTKVGVYAVFRIYTLLFGPEAGPLANLLQPWLLPFALFTLMLGAVTVVGGRNLRALTGGLVVSSVGMLMLGLTLDNQNGLAAALYYLPHSTWVVATFYLMADWLQVARGSVGDGLVAAPRMTFANLAGLGFLVAATMAAGLPPFGGFLSKAWLLAAVGTEYRGWIFSIVLMASLLSIIGLARAGSVLFWKTTDDTLHHLGTREVAAEWSPIVMLLALLVAISFGAGPIADYCLRAADQLQQPALYWRALGLEGGVPHAP